MESRKAYVNRGRGTEAAPGTGDGGGAGEIGGVVEQREDGGGGIRPQPLDEVEAPILLLRLHSPNPNLCSSPNPRRRRIYQVTTRLDSGGD